ncbi:lipopolysaccharide biosynthesis protein [Chitinophaga pendula]|uniref:Wzz/FepE/Etk N-terminal domain-containing protein n=1 Tax=Chitinophaga TaxID=79328 RepID=UPI000BAEC572|nr:MULTISPECIES: Wzz/FepE/Etk N-terminal domain-containing protein [Chitinophaga]ASZ10688.1 lipopolysaccharide biosynthesis protein [Chitinophaga sp. MD30]UCJ06339.1 lipopolysaccharide biosynthesis protein [Chitinophaga pendula]
MEPTRQTYDSPNAGKQISLKEIILKLQQWYRYLLAKWWLIIIVGLIGAGLGLGYAIIKQPNYVGEVTFVLEESKNSPLGAYAGIASQFGIDLGGTGSGVFAGDNILEFLKSRLMVEKTLLSPVKVDGQQISLIELYIRTYKLRDRWKKFPSLAQLSYPIDKDRSSFSLQQDSILYDLYNVITKANLKVAKPDKKLSFISVKCVSRNELFSKIFTERLVSEATDFYVKTKTQRSKKNVDMLQHKADSLEALLNRKTYSAAATQDLNFNPARRVATVGTEVASRDKLMLQTVYAEVVKNLEVSRVAMAQEAPIIQIVDTPIMPLKKEQLGKLKGIVFGGTGAAVLMMILLLLNNIYRELMNNL